MAQWLCKLLEDAKQVIFSTRDSHRMVKILAIGYLSNTRQCYLLWLILGIGCWAELQIQLSQPLIMLVLAGMRPVLDGVAAGYKACFWLSDEFKWTVEPAGLASRVWLFCRNARRVVRGHFSLCQNSARYRHFTILKPLKATLCGASPSIWRTSLTNLRALESPHILNNFNKIAKFTAQSNIYTNK